MTKGCRLFLSSSAALGLALGASLLAVTGCDDEAAPTVPVRPTDGGGQGTDGGGPGTDGSASDAGAFDDAGAREDGGAPNDAGFSGDSGMTPAIRCEELSTGDVLIHGSASSTFDGLVAPGSPRRPCGALPEFQWEMLAPDGSVLYADGNEIRRMVPDDLVSEGSVWSFGTDPLGNDELIATPGCDGEIASFRVAPDTGNVAYSCRPNGGLFYDQAGEPLAEGAGLLLALGTERRSLHLRGLSADFIVLEADGTLIDVAVEDESYPPQALAARSHDGGFWVAMQRSISASPMERWAVAYDGTFADEGELAPLPEGVNEQLRHRFAADGSLYSVGLRASGHQVYRRELGGDAAELVYDEGQSAGGGSSGPFVRIGADGVLVSGP